MSVPRPPDDEMAVIHEDTAEFRAVEPERVPPPAPGPPPGWLRAENPWPWLLLLLVVVAGILIWLFLVRGHSNRHVVPRVVGLSQPAAVARLNKDGFGSKAVLQPSRRPRGQVFAQKPGAGSQLKKGQTVEIDVSNGVKPTTKPTTTSTTSATTSTTPKATKVAIPDVTGKQLPDAGAALAAAGLVPNSAPVASGDPPGTVTAQSPASGTSAAAGSAVSLSVSKGQNEPAVSVPDVTGQTTAAALTALWNAKLTARTIYRSGKAGVVLQQQPGPGQAPAYTQVTLSVGR